MPMNDDNPYKMPNSHNSLELHHDRQQTYPKHVSGRYTLYGSLTFSLLVSIFIMTTTKVGQETSISDFALNTVGVFLFALLPFFTMGVIIAKNEMRIIKLMDYLKIGMIGFLCCALFLFVPILLLVLLLGVENMNYRLLFTYGFIRPLIMSALSGISAMIMAKLVIPKGAYNKKINEMV